MKVAINLLPPVYRRQRLIRRRVLEWSVVLLVVLSAICAARGYKLREFQGLERQLQAASRESRPAKVMLGQITEMRTQIERLNHHQAIAQQLEQQRQVLALLGAVSEAARQTRGKLHVTDCRVVDLQATEVAQQRSNNKSQAGTVTLLGVALDSPTVVEFHDGLVRSRLFADVKLIKSNEHNQVGTALYDYEVRCEL